MKAKKSVPKKSIDTITRREFLGGSATAAAAFMVVPRHVLGGQGNTPPSDKLNIACVGVGGKGSSDIRSVSTENIVALCDVDDTQTAGFIKSDRNTPEQKEMYLKRNGAVMKILYYFKIIECIIMEDS